MLIDEIKIDLTVARKNRESEAVSVLSTLIGELTNSAKMVDGEKIIDDDNVVRTIKRFVKNIKETVAISPKSEYLMGEVKILEKYLPKSLSINELEIIIRELVKSGADNIGKIMAVLKSSYQNQYNGAEASRIANEILKGN